MLSGYVRCPDGIFSDGGAWVSFGERLPPIGSVIYCMDDDGDEREPRGFYGTVTMDGETFAVVGKRDGEFWPDAPLADDGRNVGDMGLAYLSCEWAYAATDDGAAQS